AAVTTAALLAGRAFPARAGAADVPPAYGPPSVYGPAPGYGPPPGYSPSDDYTRPPAYGPPSAYGPPPGYSPSDEYGPPPAYNPPSGYPPPSAYRYDRPDDYGPPTDYGPPPRPPHAIPLPFRRAATRYAPRRVIASGDAVLGAADGGRCVIQRSLRQSTMRDPTAVSLIAAMVRHRVQATTALMRGISELRVGADRRRCHHANDLDCQYSGDGHRA